MVNDHPNPNKPLEKKKSKRKDTKSTVVPWSDSDSSDEDCQKDKIVHLYLYITQASYKTLIKVKEEKKELEGLIKLNYKML